MRVPALPVRKRTARIKDAEAGPAGEEGPRAGRAEQPTTAIIDAQSPLLPPWPERSPGPKPVDDRLCLQGVLYVLHQAIAWQLLTLEPRFGSGLTCWRRLDRCQ
ncbi:transposase [Streptomyces sp. NPDC002533]